LLINNLQELHMHVSYSYPVSIISLSQQKKLQMGSYNVHLKGKGLHFSDGKSPSHQEHLYFRSTEMCGTNVY